jgi:hypothetical protein
VELDQEVDNNDSGGIVPTKKRCRLGLILRWWPASPLRFAKICPVRTKNAVRLLLSDKIYNWQLAQMGAKAHYPREYLLGQSGNT